MTAAAAGRPQQVHDLKSWPGDFEAVAVGRKTAEVRRCDDRDFRVGDVLRLREYDPGPDLYTGRQIRVLITHVDRMAGPLILFGAHQGSEEGVPLAMLSIGKIA